MWRDEPSLLDVVVAARRTSAFVAGVDREVFFSDELLQSAVLYQIAIMGEATKRLSRAYREEHAGIPRRKIAGMRDRLIHGYDKTNINRVWNVVSVEIPILLAQLEPLLPSNET